MELLTNIIVEYLKHNKRLVVPKLGAFIAKQAEGKLMFSELMRNDDGVLRSLLIAYGVNEIEANGMIDRLVFEIRHAVANGNSYTIERFGSFSAGENNTITFKQYREPRSVGGNIRPPFEHLDQAKRSLQRTQGALNGTTKSEPQRRSAANKTKSVRPVKERAEEDSLNLSKPESYLRGLKYENKKSKGHDEEFYRNEKRITFNGRKVVMVIIASLILGLAAWLVWGALFSSDSSKAANTANIEKIETTAAPCDSIPSTPGTDVTPESTTPEVGDNKDAASDEIVNNEVTNNQLS